MTSTESQTTTQPMTRPEGGGASITGGLSGIFFTLIKLTGITAVVLLIERAAAALDNRKLRSMQR